jgi:hypothetical protein
VGSLSIWTHHLKDFEYLPSISIGDYEGKAARVAAGIQTYDLLGHSRTANVTILEPGRGTVGTFNSYFIGSGHSTYTSYYGLAADQILSIQVVTADGRFVTADPSNNTNLCWALRGGGGGDFLSSHPHILHAQNLQELTVSLPQQSPKSTIQYRWDSQASCSPQQSYQSMSLQFQMKLSGKVSVPTSSLVRKYTMLEESDTTSSTTA